MKLRDKSPMRKKRARGLCLFFSAVACLVSAVIWWTSEDLDLIDHLIVSGSPFAFGAVSYLRGLHVSDDAYGA